MLPHVEDDIRTGVFTMSVILFSKDEVYTEMANAYESLKHLLFYDGKRDERDIEFYTSLRRLYFANVAAWLCNYHDDESPLSAQELGCIDTFDLLDAGRHQFPNNHFLHLHKLVRAWGS